MDEKLLRGGVIGVALAVYGGRGVDVLASICPLSSSNGQLLEGKLRNRLQRGPRRL